MKLLTVLTLLFVSGCASLPQTPEGFQHKTVQTEHFSLAVWEKENIQKNKTLRFYIEGNGTPNPSKPIALQLAEKDKHANIIVLSRPCQYESDNELCKNKNVWGTEQYHPEILKEMQEVIVYYIQRHNASNIEFVAYNDGAPIAFNLSPKIGRVNKIITISGVLDTDAYTKQNKLPPFVNAQNPAQNTVLIAQIPQIHYVGEKDHITTRAMAERFVSRLPRPRSAVVKMVPNVGHADWDNVQLDY